MNEFRIEEEGKGQKSGRLKKRIQEGHSAHRAKGIPKTPLKEEKTPIRPKTPQSSIFR